MGDPAGVGPEICLTLLSKSEQLFPDLRLTVYGDAPLLEKVAQHTGLPLPSAQQVRHIGSLPADHVVEPGKVAAAHGQAGYDYLQNAIEDALSGEVDGIVTAPLNKLSLREAGVSHPGHTEILAELTQSTRYCMLQYSQEVTASFVTCHCGYADVPKFLTRERLREVIDLTHEAVSRILQRPPRLLALGLNPHAGEEGLFGNQEEEAVIIPEVVGAQERGIDIAGPLPPDTAFIPSKRSEIDAYICMYHDQGHIPLKALAFDSAVNVTLGLPIVRTSVDHGTAFDIAWQGKADPGSLISATKLACKLVGLPSDHE